MGASSDVDWSRVVLWWGDERFVAADSDDRNARQAMSAFGDRLAFDPAKVHEVPSTADASSVDDAAAAYSAQLREHGAGSFEVLMLGVGPDGHVASLFPGSPQLDADDQVAVGVTGSPKPPPERVSLTFAALNRSRVGLVPGQRRGEGRRRRPRAGPRHRPARDTRRRRHRRGRDDLVPGPRQRLRAVVRSRPSRLD